jgi:hypothetical protein
MGRLGTAKTEATTRIRSIKINKKFAVTTNAVNKSVSHHNKDITQHIIIILFCFRVIANPGRKKKKEVFCFDLKK